MADKKEDAGKAKAAPKQDKSPEAAARAEKAQAAKDKAAAKKKAEGGEKKPREPEERVTPRLRTQFDQVIRKAMTEKFSYQNPMQVPRLEKIVLNMGVGEGVADRKKVEQAAEALTAIVGQKAVITRSRKSIATYKLRENQPIGCKVTLRNARMYEFLDRLVNIALPRVRDFRGLNPKSFDGRGNYSLGIKEHIVFPEIDYDKIDEVWGMDITVCTTARTDDEARALLTAPGGTNTTYLTETEARQALYEDRWQNGGLALWRLANERREVIPVFAEMGTVNPVIVTTDAAAEPGRVATGFVSSMTLGAGQFCTKPGLLLAPEGAGLADALGAAVSATQVHPMLTAAMAAGVSRGVEAYEAAGGQVIGTGSGASAGWSAAPTVVHVPAELFTRESVFAEECFGPVGLVVEYTDRAHLESLLAQLQGSLVATVASSGPHDPETADLVALLARSVGRVTVDDWPTGVAWTWAQQHGGPWPATSAPASTSVGAAALDRFTRPVTFQNLPDSALPPALRHDNPGGLPRRINGRMN